MTGAILKHFPIGTCVCLCCTEKQDQAATSQTTATSQEWRKKRMSQDTCNHCPVSTAVACDQAPG